MLPPGLPGHRPVAVTTRRRSGPTAARLRAAVLALAAWLAVAAAHAQTPSDAKAPGQVGIGAWGYDHYAPGDHRSTGKTVFSYPGKLKVSWRPPANDGGSAVTAYRVYWYQTADHAGTVQSVDVAPSGAGVHVHYVTGLTDGTEYGVGVTAVNAAGEGPFRNGSGAALASLPYTSPRDDMNINVPNPRDAMQVRDLAAARGAANVLRVTWRRPSGSRVLDHYEVSWARAGSAAVAGSVEVAKTATSVDLTGLTGGRKYRIEVDTIYRPNSGAERSLTATEVTSATPYGAPTAPRELQALGNDGELAVSWAAPAADGGSPVTGYRLTWTGAGASGSADLAAGAREHTIASLTNDRAYTVTVAAANAYYAGPAASGGDTPFLDSAPSFGDATVPAQTRTANVPGAPSLTLPAASGGNFGLTYRLTPAVTGLTFDPETRVLSGTVAYAGTYEMTYRVDDGDRIDTDADADTLTFTLTASVNRAPTAAPIAKTTHENVPVSFAKSDFTGSFSDPNPGDSLSAVFFLSRPKSSAGRLTLDGAALPHRLLDPQELDTLVFTPAADYSGSATFRFLVVDQPGASALGTVTITVHANDPPQVAASTAPYRKVAGGSTVTLTNSSRDPDGDTMTWRWEQTGGTAVTLSDATAESPTFTAPNRVERLTFRLTATDEHGAAAAETVSLEVVLPPAAPATLTAGTDNARVTLRWTAGAANGAAITSWWYRHSADGGANWSDWRQGGAGAHVYRQQVTGLQNHTRHTFAVRARNAAGDGPARTVAVTLGPAPPISKYPPIARATWGYQERRNEQGYVIQRDLYLDGRATTDADLSGDEHWRRLRFRWTQVRDDSTVPVHEPRWPTSSTPYLWPEPKYPVDLLYKLTVTDGAGLTGTTYLPVSIRYPAGRPSLGLTRSISLGMQQGQTLSRTLPAATGGDGALTYTLTPAVSGVMSFNTATRQVTFTPSAAGTWNFKYKVADSHGDSDTIRVSLRAAANAKPQFGGASIRNLRFITGRDYGPITSERPLPPLPLATGGDGDLSYTLTPAVPGLSFDPATRRISGTPTAAGSYAMTYRAADSDTDDSDADSAALNFTITVVANSPPVALFAGQTVDVSVKIPGPEWGPLPSNYPYGVDLRGYFYDPDGDELRFEKRRSDGTILLGRCTVYRYKHCVYPLAEGLRLDAPFVAVDPSGAQATQTFRITGLPANRAPVVSSKASRQRDYGLRNWHVVAPLDSRDVRDGIVIGRCARPRDVYSQIQFDDKRLILYFHDPDGDPLTYSARSSNPRATVRVDARPDRVRPYPSTKNFPAVSKFDRERTPHLTINHHVIGDNWKTTVTVTATDPRGLSASLDIPVTSFNSTDDDGSCAVTVDHGFDATIADQSWPANKAIVPLILPGFRGQLPLSYTLTPQVPGLTLDSVTHTLSGTPTTAAAATAMTYRATDSADPARTGTLSFSITITAADQAGTSAPTSGPVRVIIDEDTLHTFAADQFPFSDADADEQLHQLRIETLPAHGTLLLGDVEQSAGATIARADLGTLQYRPPADWYGGASFTFKVLDTTRRASAQAYVASVTVRPVDDAPTSTDFERTVAEDGALTFASADFAFSDADRHVRSAVVIASLPAAAAGALTLDGTAVSPGQKIAAPSDSIDGTLRFTPAADWNGAATFHFGVEDSSGAASLVSNTATIRVTAVDDAPATADITRSMEEDATLDLTLADFAFTDADPDDRLKAIVIEHAPRSGTPPQPAGKLTSFHGSVETVIDGDDTVAAAGLTRLEYRPDADFAGEATFTFQVTDQADAVSDVATGTVQVAPVNDPPTSQAFTIAGAEDEAVTLAAASFVFRDPDAGDSLKAVAVAALPDAAHGALAANGSPVEADDVIAAGDLGSVTFTPVADWFGNAQFTFRVVDRSDARSAAAYAATIAVAGKNDAPTAQDFTRKWAPALDFQALFESAFADPDPDDRLRAIVLVGTPTGGALWRGGAEQAAGAVIEAADLGALEFRPSDGIYRASIGYRVQDLAGEASASSYTLGLWWNSPPSAAALALRTREDAPLPLAPADFDGVFTDADADDGLAAVVVTTPPAAAQGALALDGAAVGAGQVIDRKRLVGLAFTPAANWNGAATFGFRVRDGDGADSAAATATVTVTAVADAPVAGALAVSTAEDTALAFTAAHFEGVFSDGDPDDRLKAVRVATLPPGTAGVLALDGTAVSANGLIAHGDLGKLVFTPVANWHGQARFTFKVVDQSDTESAAAAALVTVTSVADAPVASALQAGTAEDTVLAFTAAEFKALFSDVDGDRLKAVTVVSLPDAGHGALALASQERDDADPKPGEGGPGREPGLVVPRTRAVAGNEVIALDRLGALRFAPAQDWNGAASFTFRVVDQTDAVSAPATATIAVTGVGDAPMAGALNLSTAEDEPLAFTAADFDAAFSDPDPDDSLAAVRVASLPAAAGGELALNGTAVTASQKIARADLGTLTFTPVANWSGDASFTFRVVDKSDTESAAAATAAVTVTAVADAPAAAALKKITAEDTAVTFAAADFTEVFSDADPGDSLKAVKVVRLPAAAHGALTLPAPGDGERKPGDGQPEATRQTRPVTAGQVIAHGDLGKLTFTPPLHFAGEATFEFQVVDRSDTASAAAAATIGVTAVADAPSAGALAVSTAEDTALAFTAAHFEGVFTDPDGDRLKQVRVVRLPDAGHGALALDGTAVAATQEIAHADLGDLAFTPAANWNGDAAFGFKVVDQSDAESAAATATVTVTAVNDAPSAGALAVSTAEDTALAFTAAHFEGVFTDADAGDSLAAVRVASLPDAGHGALALDGTAVTADQKIAHADLGDLAFTPAANWHGDAAFDFKVVDQSDGESAAATATVTVTAVPDAPSAGALAVSTAEDTALAFAAAQFEGVFTDADAGDSLKAVRVASLPDAAHGELALDGTAVAANQVIAQGNLDDLAFTPLPNWNGAATFTFKVVDQTDAESAAATATVTVTAVADAPVAGALAVSTAEDTALTFAAAQFEGVFTDLDAGDSLKSVMVVSLPAAAQGALALDGTAVTANQVIARGDLRDLTFTPAADWNGAATFTFKVVDQTDAESAAATATITVTAVADAPVAGALNLSTAEDTALTFAASDFTGVFTDADAGDSLKSVKVASLPAAAQGALALDGTAVTANQAIARGDLRDLTFTPAADWNGDATFTFKVVDQTDAESAAATATVTVTAVADAPAAGALARSMAEDTVLTFAASDFTGVFTDADAGDSLKSVKVVTLPAAAHGWLALDGESVSRKQVIAQSELRTLTFKPHNDVTGAVAFTFQVLDQSSMASATATATITVTPVNDAPVAAALRKSTAEDTALTFAASDFEGVFRDVDAGDSLKAVKVVTLPLAAHGALALSGTALTADQKVAHADLGSLTFTPAANWTGRAGFTFKVVDQADLESDWAAPAAVAVTAVADAPVAAALRKSTAEDTVLTFAESDFQGVFTDPDANDWLRTVKVVTLPAAAQGALALDGTAVTAGDVIFPDSLGNLTFTPAANFTGQATFGFRMSDRGGHYSATATATVTVVAENDLPAARPLAKSTAEDTVLRFAASDFEGVFDDPDAGDGLAAVLVLRLPAAAQGALALDGTAVTRNDGIEHGDLGTLTFTPAADFTGAATFDFTVMDQEYEESETTTATVTVTAVADPPVAGALGVSTAEDTALRFAASDFDGVFSDPDAGDSLKAVKVVTLPAAAQGALALGASAVTAGDVIARGDLETLTFTPLANWSGQATFTFKVADQSDAESAAATATITVSAANDAPEASALGVSTAEDTALTFTAAHFDGVFSDRDTGDSLKAVRVVTLPAATAGALALSGSAVTANDLIARGDLGTLTFTPVEHWNGQASFTFKVADRSDAESAAATATVTVSAANDAPEASALGVSTAEDTALTFTAAHFDGVFTDADTGDGLKAVRVVTLPAAAHGALALNGSAVTANDLVARGDLGTLTFTPVGHWNGQASFTFKVADQSDAESAAATATVTVSAVNDAPAAGALGVSTAEDTALTFTAVTFDGVFTDADTGDGLKAVRMVTLPAAAHGALALNGSAVTANRTVVRADLESLRFTPVGHWNGQASFTFKVADQSGAESAAATATVTVTAVADPPVAGALGKSTAEDTALTFAASDFDGVFSDPDAGDSLKAAKVVSLPAAAQGALALGASAVTAGDVIARGDLQTLTFTPVANFTGAATFTFQVRDPSDRFSATATATVTVGSANDAPAARALGVSTAEDTALTFTADDFDGVFTDPDAGDSLKAVRVVTLPPSTAGVLTLGDSAVTANRKIARGSVATLKFTPAANWNGQASFTFKVADQSDAESAAATATITVSAANDAPAASALGVSTTEDTALAFTAAHFDGVFTDADTGDSLKAVRVVTLPAGTAGALALNGSAVTANDLVARGSLASLKFTPVGNYAGQASFTFKVADQSDAESAAATATVTVSAVNDAPAASALGVSTAEDTALTFTAAQFTGVFSDADTGDSLKAVRVVTLPAAAHGALALNGTAVTANRKVVRADLVSLKFTPVGNWNGQASFTFKAADQSDAESAVATATITVSAVNDAPAASALGVSTAEDTALTFTAAQFTGVFSDADTGDSLKAVRVVTLPAAAHGALALNGTAVTANQTIVKTGLGTLKFTPAANYAGKASFTFKVVDQSDAESAAATATVTVNAADDAPEAEALGVSTAEDTALTFTAAQFAGVFSDADTGDSLKAVKVVTLPASTAGALALSGTAVTANQAIVKASLGSLTFTPAANWNGQATFTFKVADQSDAESAAATATVTVSAVNDAPAAVALGVSTAEDTALTFTAAQFTGVFSDLDTGDSLKAVRVVTLPAPAAGALALDGTAVTAKQKIVHSDLGKLTFTPAADYAGTATFTFKVVDQSDAESAAATATVTVSAANDVPAAGALSVSTAEDTALTFTAAQFAGVFTDADTGDSLKAVRVVTLPAAAHGALALSGTAVTANRKIVKTDLGSLKFTPVGNWNGQATFTFKVVDQSDAESAAATATVTVSAVNDAPAAGALGASTAEDTALTFTAAQFTGVFTDNADTGDSLKAVRVVTLPAAAAGALALSGTAVTAKQKIVKTDLGSLTFTPVADWNGQATFTFKVVDQSDAESAAATATVTVSAANDAPAAGALGVSTAEDTALTFTAAQFTGVFSDADTGDSLKAVRVVTLPAAAHGALALNGTAVTANRKIAKADVGSLKFTPAANWNGQTTFTFKVADQSDAESAAATATVTVSAANDAPAAGALGVSTAEDTALTFTAAQFTGVFSDADTGDSLKAVRVVTLPAAAAGALALNGTAVTANQKIAKADVGSLKFTPAANWNGQATFTFKVADQSGTESAAATATVTVSAVADAPAARALNVSTAEDTALTFTAGQFAGVFSDADAGDSLKSVRVVTLPAATAGALALNGTALTANRKIAKGDLGSLTFTPAANWHGSASFTFKVADQSGTESAAATATITVSAANDAPTVSALGVSTSEDTALAFTAASFDGVFADTDPGDRLKAVKVVTLPAATAGALALGDSAVAANQVIARGSLGTLKFTPAANWHGAASFTFKVMDRADAESAAATATVTVTAVADAPKAGALGVNTAEDTALTFTAAHFTAVFSDPDAGDSLKQVKVVSLPAAAAGALALNGTAVTASQVIARGSLGTLKFTPAANWHGKASFTFKVADQSGTESATATATVTVTAVADAPKAGALGVSTNEDTALAFTAARFEGVFSDPDAGDSLKQVKVVSLPGAAAGALALNGTAVTANRVIAHADLGSLTFTPAANWNGQATFTFKVVDQSDAESAAATATVTVTAVADAPAASALGVSTAEDTALTFTAARFEGVFSDPDAGDSLKQVNVVSLPGAAAGALALNGTAVTANQKVAHGSLGTLTFTPAANWNGQATFTFKVVDQSDAESAAATATVTVSAVNDAPAAGALGVSTTEDTALAFTAAQFEGVFTDVDTGDSLKAVQVETLPAAAAGALALNGTAVTANKKVAHADLGTLTFTPAANYAGTASFTFKVVDQSDAASAAATATITVGGANDAPVASALNVSTAENTALTFTAAQFEGAFSDPDAGDSLKQVQVETLPAATAGALALNGTAVTANQKIAHASLGTLTFTPVANWNGQATFTFKVVDQSDAESADAATATITVSAVADAPAAAALGVSTAEDTALTFTAAQFEGVFSDADPGDSLKAVKVVTLPAATAGAVALGGTGVAANQVIAHGSLGTLTFTPAADYAGSATFGFQVSDKTDRLSATATATVTVTAVADAPAAGELEVSTAEDTALTFTAAQFEGVFSDPDTGDSLKAVQVTTLPDAGHGVLALSGTAVTANGQIAKADLGSLTFTPVADWNGDAAFTFKVLDQAAAASAAATATVKVTAVNDAPAAAALAVSTDEDTELSFTAADFDAAFSDPDPGDSLKVVQVVTLPDAGHGVLALDGTAVTANRKVVRADLGSLTFTPVADWNGDATFTFKVVDQADAASAAATATVTVAAVDDPPAPRQPSENDPGEPSTPADPDAALLALSTAEDTALPFTAAQFEAVFSDPDENDSLKAVQVATLPSAAHGALALSGTAVTANQKVAHADLGSLTFTPVADWNGDAAFTFKLLDQTDAASDAAKAAITVTAVNDAPTAAALSLSTAPEVVLTFSAQHFERVFSDVDAGDSLKAVQVVTLPSAPHGTLALGGTAVTAGQEIAHGDLGTLKFTPAVAFTSSATFTFKVLDQSAAASATATATITATDHNDVPVAPGRIPDQTATQGVAYRYTAPSDLFTDPDGDALVWNAVARDAGGDPGNGGPGADGDLRRLYSRGDGGGAQGDGGDESGALPDWLGFSGNERTFDGTPGDGDVGASRIRVIATDPDGAFAYAEFDLRVLPPVQVSISGPAAPVAEGASAFFTVALSRAAHADVTVRWATADGTGGDAATAGSDYTGRAATDVTIAAGQTEGIVAVVTLADDEDEDAETFSVRLSSPAGGLAAGFALGTSSATASIVDAPPAPPPPDPKPNPDPSNPDPSSPASTPTPSTPRDERPRLSLATPATVREGETAVVAIVLSKPVAQAFTVHWATADGTASATGGDYERRAAAVTFAAGDTRRSARVATYADYLEEGAETFRLGLSAPRALPDGVVLGTSRVTVTIADNRRPVADAGPDQEVDPGATVALDGSASHDPDDDPITGYAWTQTAGIEVALDDASSATPSFTAPELPGALTFALVVDSDGLDSLPDEVTVTVRDLAPRFLHTVDALTFVAEREIEPLTLPAATGGNGPLSYELSSEPAGLAGLKFDPATRVLSGTPERGGRLTFTYVAHDADDNRELSDAAVLTFVVTVQDAPYRRILRPVLAAIGRATLYEARAVIGSRFEPAAGGRKAGSLTLAGRQAALGAAARPASEGAQAEQPEQPEPSAEAAPAQWRVADWDREVGPVSSPATVAELLGDSAFEVPLTAAAQPAEVRATVASGAPGPVPHWTLWGRGHRHGFSGEPEPGASYEGDLNTAWVGLEAAAADATWLMGVAVARTLHGSAEYAVEGGDDPGERGRVEVAVTGLYPYAWYRPAAGTEYSVVLGGGRGEAVHERDGAPRESSDLTVLLGSVGARHGLHAFDGRLEVALRGDAGFAHLRTGNGDQALDELTANAGNVRIGVQAAMPLPLGSAALRPFVEVAGRYDDGDDVTGFGVEVAGGVSLAAERVELEARGRVLALHTAAGHREHGASVTARLTADSKGRGLSAELSPRWGASATGADVLWQDYLPAAAAGAAEQPEQPGQSEQPASLDGRVGYGVALAGTGGVLTPFAEVGLSDGAAQRLRVGARFDVDRTADTAGTAGTAGTGLAVELSGERRVIPGAAPDYQLILELRFRY